MLLHVDAHSPIPIRWQLTEQLKHVIERGGVSRDQALPSIRELAGFLGINPNTVARAIEDLKRSGHVEARRGKGVFVAPALAIRPFLTRREDFLKDAVIRAAALEMTPDDVAVGVLSLAGVGLPAVRGAVAVLLVECSPPELDFFRRELEAHLPVRVDTVLLNDLATVVRRQTRGAHWAAAVTSFGHLPEVERRLAGLGVPVVALLAEVHLETLHRLAQLPSGTRVGVVAAAVETAHNLEHSIANAALPNIARVEACPAEERGRHCLFHLGRHAGPGTRGSHSARDHRRPGAQSAGHPDARVHPGPAGRRPPDCHAAPRPEAAESTFVPGRPRPWRATGETARGKPCAAAP
jgi:DNA-binding transcriptional regulator YhcF (GntR family)